MEVQLLFVDFRGSSHVVLEWLCSLRDDIAPGSVRRILSRVDLHIISRLLLFFFISCPLLVFRAVPCIFMGFKDLPGRPF